MKRGLIGLLLGAAVATVAEAQTVGTCSPAMANAYLDVGNVRARILNNGNLFYRGEPHVYNVPKGSKSNAIYASSIWIGGMVGDELHIAATKYGPYEFWAGPLDEDGAPPADCGRFERIWSVYRDDVQEFERTGVATPDLAEWPTGLGAPTLDARGKRMDLMDTPHAARVDRVIDLAAGERPALTGDQTVWWVMNDVGNLHEETGSPPVGLEVHAEAFAFDRPGHIGNATFYRYRILYRGEKPLTEAYVGVYADVDLGDAADDWIGTDSTLGLAFMYNADNEDGGGEGYGTPPPAIGFDLLQAPIVPSPGDAARQRGRAVPDHRNLTAALLYHQKSGGAFAEPMNGVEYYRNLTGRFRNGDPITFGGPGFGFSNTPTRFVFPGDPITNAFWSMRNSDGLGTSLSPGDKRFYLSAGPFEMQPGDEQEIVFAVVWARGADNFDSVRALREADRVADNLYAANFDVGRAPDPPEVTVIEGDGRVELRWSYSPESNNYLDSYRQTDPFVAGASYELEGYEVLRYREAGDAVGRVVAVYDRVNGVRRVMETAVGDLQYLGAEGTDAGLASSHVFEGLANHGVYHFGVRAYAYGARSTPHVWRGTTTRVTAIPTLRGSLDPAGSLEKIGIVPNPYRGASAYEVDGRVGEVRFTNMPDVATVRIFTLSGTLIRTLFKNGPDSILRWNLETDNALVIGNGVYLVHIEVPGVGERVLKFAVVRQRPFGARL